MEEMHLNNYRKRVVVTGIGPVTPVGIGKESYWESLVHGKTAFKRICIPESGYESVPMSDRRSA